MKTRTSFITSCLAFSMLFFSFTPFKKIHATAASSNTIKKAVRKNYIDNPYYIIISKKDYELKVYDDQGWYATYPCVFGSSDLRDKYVEGDKRTPEGKFKVLLKKGNSKWSFELLLDYPNEESIQKFKQRIAEGLIPKKC